MEIENRRKKNSDLFKAYFMVRLTASNSEWESNIISSVKKYS